MAGRVGDVHVGLDHPAVQDHVDEPGVRHLLARGVEPRGDLNDRKLAILWRASDANLSARPITLWYAENAAGPWTPI